MLSLHLITQIEYNGFKMVWRGSPLYGDRPQIILDDARRYCGKFDSMDGQRMEAVAITTLNDISITINYVQHVCGALRDASAFGENGVRKMKILWDLANGATYDVITHIISQMTEWHGAFIEHKVINAGSNNLVYDEDLGRSTLIEEQFDLAIKFDQDGDRIELIHSDGMVLGGEIVLVLLARYLYNPRANNHGVEGRKTKMQQEKIIVDIKTSATIIHYLRQLGFNVIVCRTGHVFIKEKMREEQAILAGEASGHIYHAHVLSYSPFVPEMADGIAGEMDNLWGKSNEAEESEVQSNEICHYDDAVFAAMQMIEIIARNRNAISETLASLPKTFISPEITIFYNELYKADHNTDHGMALASSSNASRAMLAEALERIMDKVLTGGGVLDNGSLCRDDGDPAQNGGITINDIDGVRYQDDSLGWWLIRCSNTEECLTIRLEGYSEKAYDYLAKMVHSLLHDEGLEIYNMALQRQHHSRSSNASSVFKIPLL